MKEIVEPVRPEHSPGTQEFSNRKLVRPSLPPDRAPSAGHNNHSASGERRERHGGAGFGKRTASAEQTNAENFYYQKQMQTNTPMVVVLKDGERVQGVIEWYDRACIKMNRAGSQSNLIVYKSAIKYMYKESEGSR
jgi:host factor-I protein